MSASFQHPTAWHRAVTLGCWWAVVAALATFSSAASAQQRITVRSAYVEPVDGVYELNATFEVELPDAARRALRDGVTLTFDIELVVRRPRNYWLDKTVATLEQHYELVFHALSERYLVRNLNSDEQASFATLDAAIDSLRVIAHLPILDQAVVIPETRPAISLRASVAVRTTPDALRFVLFWAANWRQHSEWYTWSPQL